MQNYRPGASYYALTLTASADNTPIRSVQSHFVGRSRRFLGWEMRIASVVIPPNMVSIWEDLGQPWVAVHSRAQLSLWIHLGGNALVETGLAQEMLPDWVCEREVAPDGIFGFLNAETIPPSKRRRRPTRKVGKEVARRDGDRCQRCERSGEILDLAKHHVLPFAAGGLTQTNNLVLLCEDCHAELHRSDTWQPDTELVGTLMRVAELEKDHDAAVERHRRLIRRVLHPGETNQVAA